MQAYVGSLVENSRVLLVAMNNQSFAAWYLAHRYPAGELFEWHVYALPGYVKTIGLVASVGAAVFGGLLDRSWSAEAPYGAVFVMVATMVFTPIAWTHYFIVLVVPAMLMLAEQRRSRSLLWAVVPAVVFCLSLYPVSHGAVAGLYHRFPASGLVPYLVRGQFYSGIVCLVSLVGLHAAVEEESPVRLRLSRVADGRV
jgi:hypothetical protein